MGAIHFSIDLKLIDVVRSNLNLTTFVETGTFKGQTIDLIKNIFHSIYTIELSEEYHANAKEKFKNFAHINVMAGDSAQSLTTLMPQVANQSTLFWLDAHWCVASNTAGLQSQCPLLAELKAIKQLNADSLIIIDDARLFLATPPKPHEISDWPNFNEVSTALNQLSPLHNLMIINDNILFYPRKIEQAIQCYAHQHGVDWLHAADKTRDFDKLLSQLKEKERQISVLTEHCEHYQKKILSIEKRIGKILTKAYSHKINNFIKFLVKSLIGRPKLGVLKHYPPEPLIFPKKYYAAISCDKFPRISIVTPSYHHGIFLERTIKSVLDQNYKNLEYIVQDGGSTDGTTDILAKYSGSLKHWDSSKDKGQSEAINKGFQHATGEIMAYLNSDDILTPGTLQYVGNFFAKNPTVDVVYGHRILINEYDHEIGRWVLPTHDAKVLSWADYIPQETLFWRRRIWEEVGGKIDESFSFAMDWDLLLRFRDANAKFVRLPRFLAAFRIHEQQKTSAHIANMGVTEMQRLQERCHAKQVSEIEIKNNIKTYLVRHILFDRLYRLGILRY